MAGLLTQTELIEEVLDNVSKSTSAQTKSGKTLSAMALRYLNRAQNKVAREEDLLFCISTASTIVDQQSYAMPSNIRSLFSLRLENGLQSVKLKPAMPWEFDRLVPKANETTSRQSEWYIPYKTTNTFELYPIPDAVYTMRLRYSYWPTVLAAASQTSDYTYMDDVLIYYATGHLWYWLQEYEDAKAWFTMAEDALRGAIKAEREAIPDWEPVSQGFSSNYPRTLGEYYNDPFIGLDPSRSL